MPTAKQPMPPWSAAQQLMLREPASSAHDRTAVRSPCRSPRRAAGLWLAALTVLLLALLGAGCSEWAASLPLPARERTPWMPPTPEAVDTPVAAATAAPAIAYGGRLTVALVEPVPAINPLIAGREARKVSALLFSGLMRFDAQLRPVPDLAESWTTSPDGLSWTFKLRPGVRWHDGTTLTSDDVLFTYRVLLDAPAPTPGSSDDLAVAVAQADLQDVLEEVSAPDPYTVNFQLGRRFAPLLVDLTVPILPSHLLKKTSKADLWSKPIETGSGPFYLREMRQDALILDAFPDYFLGRPYLDRIAFVPVPDEDTLVKTLGNGQIDLAEVSPGAASRLAGTEHLQVLVYPDLTYYYVGFNLHPGHILADKAVRQAWSYALDKEGLVSGVLGSAAQPVWSDVPAYSWAYNAGLAKPGRDVAKARQLLQAAGWQQVGEDGIRRKGAQRLSVELAVRQDAPQRLRFAEAMATQLREAGIEARVAPSDYASTMAAARRPPFDFGALLMGWTIGEDPDDYYLFHSSQIPTPERPTGYNYVGFVNEEYDRLSVEARSSTDWRRREELYRRIQQILDEERPYYFLWADRVQVAVNRRLAGLPQPVSPSLWESIDRWYLRRP